MIMTGYFGHTTEPSTKVHIVEDGRPWCGCRPSGIFQWNAAGVRLDYVECKKCRSIAQKIKQKGGAE